MKFLLAVPLLIFAFLLPLITGVMAENSTYKFWLWFYTSIPLLFVAGMIVICLPAISRKKARKLNPVENEEIFDHLFIGKKKAIYYSADKYTINNYKNLINKHLNIFYERKVHHTANQDGLFIKTSTGKKRHPYPIGRNHCRAKKNNAAIGKFFTQGTGNRYVFGHYKGCLRQLL